MIIEIKMITGEIYKEDKMVCNAKEFANSICYNDKQDKFLSFGDDLVINIRNIVSVKSYEEV